MTWRTPSSEPLSLSAYKLPVHSSKVGSFEGASAVWLAEHLLLHPESLLICLDTWEGNIEFSDTIEMSAVEVSGHFRWRKLVSSQKAEIESTKQEDYLRTLRVFVDWSLQYVDRRCVSNNDGYTRSGPRNGSRKT